MGLVERLVQFGAFFKVSAIEDVLFEQLPGSPAAFRAHGINFKHEPRSATNGQGNMRFVFSHVRSIAPETFFTIQRVADSNVSVRLTNKPEL